MFKFTGCILLVIAITAIVSDRLIKCYFTYVYLNETIEILHILKSGCNMGKTYNHVMSNMDRSKYKLFFSDLTYLIADKTQTDKMDNYLKSLGKRPKSDEMDYIQFIIEQTEKALEEYKSYFDINKKPVFLTGISLGMIIIIVLI